MAAVSPRRLACLLLAVSAGSPGLGNAAPPRDELVASGLQVPTAFAILPDGRIAVAEHAGLVVALREGVAAPELLVDLRARVNNSRERGLVGLAADPGFARNRALYVLYAYEDDPARPHAPKTVRLSRIDVRSGRERVVLSGIPADCRCHIGGSIRFATDGSLFVSTGDGARAGGANALALRAQDLDSPAGKLLRVSREGRGLRDNPFWNGDPWATRSKVWALGLRNPFRLALHPRSGVPWVGDVGWRAWEEIDVAGRGANLGWPCYEGAGRQGAYASTPTCQALYRRRGEHRGPLLSYRHGPRASVTGGDFARDGAYVYGDFTRGGLRLLGAPSRELAPAAAPVDIQFAPDGSLLYLSLTRGELRRIVAPASRPTVTAAAHPAVGALVLLSSSAPAEGGPYLYSWSFGDGAHSFSTEPSPPHAYAFAGTYVATVTVTDRRGRSARSSATVTVE